MLLRSFGDYLAYLGVRTAICVVQAARMETCQTVARWLAWLFTKVVRIRHRVIDENLQTAFPRLSAKDRQALARRMWEHLFLLAIEVAHAPRKIHDTNWRDYIRLKGHDQLLRALLDDRPVVIISGHFGNFELGGFFLGVLGFPSATVARTLDNPYLHRFVNRFRGLTGQRMIAKKGGYNDILAVLSTGGTMSFLADQAAGDKGCWVDFFGRPASTHKAIALLALEHRAHVCLGAMRRVGAPLHLEMVLGDLLDTTDPNAPAGSVRELTQWYTSQLERLIRDAPEQYWWVHRRWKGTPPAARRKTRAA